MGGCMHACMQIRMRLCTWVPVLVCMRSVASVGVRVNAIECASVSVGVSVGVCVSVSVSRSVSVGMSV
jgi:hypothetical protein